MAKAFGLHPLAVEDALNAHQRPKVDRYDGSLFITLRTVWYIDEQDAVETGEINMFVGPDYVVTVRHGEGSELHTRRVDLESDAKTLGHGPFAVVYAVCDRVVDDYEDGRDVVDRRTSTRSRARSSPPTAPTTRCASTPSSGRSPRCAAPCCL